MKILKLFVLISLLFKSPLAMSNEVKNPCAYNILGIQDWSELSEPVLKCLNENSGFQNSISALCQENRTDLSVKFQKFFDYKKSYEEAVEIFRSLPVDQREEAQKAVTKAAEDWYALGYKDEVLGHLDILAIAYARCTNQH